MVRLLIVVALLAAGAARAGAQTEYTLGADGWTKTSEPEPGTDAALIAEARALLAQEKYAQARRMLTKWLDAHKFTDSPWLADAYLYRGYAREGMGDEYLALYDYEKIATEFSGTKTFLSALERELAIAIKYVHGMNRRFLGIRWYGAKSEGEETLVRIQGRLPRSVLAERAGYELVAYYFRESDLEMCSVMCDVFMQNFPRSSFRAAVLEYRIKSNLGLYAGPEYDGSYLIEARELIRQFMAEFPAEAERKGIDESALAWIDESSAQKLLTNGQWYLRRGEAASARYTLKRLVRDYSLTVAASRGYQILVDKGWAGAVAAPGPEVGGAAPPEGGEATP